MSWAWIGYPQVILTFWGPLTVIGLWRLALPMLRRLRPNDRFVVTFVLSLVPLLAVLVPYRPDSFLREALPWRAPIAWGVSNMGPGASEPLAVSLILVALSTVPFVSLAVSAIYALVQLRSATKTANASIGSFRGDLAVVDLPGFVACTVGLVRPRILIGADVLDSPSGATIVDHERAHARNRHALWIFIAACTLRSWWWVPGRGALLTDLTLSAELWADLEARSTHGAGAVAAAIAATVRSAPPSIRSSGNPLAVAAFVDPMIALTRRAEALAVPVVAMGRPARFAVRVGAVLTALAIIVLL